VYMELGQTNGLERTYLANIQSNVFPHSEPSVSVNGANLNLAWLYDDPNRTAINRSMAVFSSWDGALWSEPKPISDDGTADFHTQLLTLPDGSALAVWENVKNVMPDAATFEDIVANMEVSSAFYNSQTKVWTPAQQLTNNNYFDRSPKIAGTASDNALIVGLSNIANDLTGSTTRPNTLWFSKWNGSTWSSSQTITTVAHGIIKYDLSYTGNKADIVLSLDTDDDPSTNHDHELYSVHFENGVWGNLSRLTTDTIVDDNPRVGVDSKGNKVLVWLKGDEISSAAGLQPEARKTIAVAGYSSNVADFKLASAPDGRLSLVWAESSAPFGSDLQAIFYDHVLDVWGNQTQLTADQETEGNITAALYGNKLVAVYDRTNLPQVPASSQVAMKSGSEVSIPTPGTTDLYMLSHIIAGDLAVKPNTLEVSPANPRPGELTTLSAAVVNQGDTAVSNIPVNFYQGNPSSGGILIGTTIVSATLAPGDTRQISIPWTPTSTGGPLSIYVVVDPAQTFDDVNRANNVANKQVIKPDLLIQSVKWERQTDNSVLIAARVTNVGSLPSTPTNVSFRRDSPTGAMLASPALGVLNPDQSVDVSIQWDTTGLNAPQYVLNVTADESNAVDEYDKTNNVTTLVVSLNPNASAIQFSAPSYNTAENAGSIQITVTRTGDTAGTATVNYITSDAAAFLQNCNVTNGAATSRCDYVSLVGTLHFSAGESSKTLFLPVVDDTYLEGAEILSIILSHPTGGAVLGTNLLATITITDNGNDGTGQPNPIDGTNFFVRQHYIDFLGREPDPASIGWNNQINNCVPVQPSCDRLSVSQGIYNSPEFKDRGYFIYKFYSVALGRKPSYDEFVLDRARVSGFQTEAELEQSKLDFIADFMSRPEFAAYSGLTNDQYVLRFFNLTGITQVTVNGAVFNLSQMQQSLTTGKTRAQVLREVVESPEVSARYQVESTIVMHYFGYLRRDPDAAYQDWINIYNQSGDSRNVTNGFVNSQEYRARLGQ
jgi:Calx-beta domain/CARDB